jgi:hypothetical protein
MITADMAVYSLTELQNGRGRYRTAETDRDPGYLEMLLFKSRREEIDKEPGLERQQRCCGPGGVNRDV